MSLHFDVLYQLILSVFLAFGLWYDAHSLFLKGLKTKNFSRELISYANLIQYVSRIFFILSTFLIVAKFELSDIRKLDFQNIIITIIMINIVLLTISLKLRYRISEISLKPIRLILFSDLKYTVDFSTLKKTHKKIFWYISGCFMQILMMSAIFLPIVIASRLPDFRMTLAYIGQILNFSFTFLVLALIEPRLFRMIDSMDEINSEKADTIISDTVNLMIKGKIFGAFLFCCGVMYVQFYS